jgi:hypothetical protein
MRPGVPVMGQSGGCGAIDPGSAIRADVVRAWEAFDHLVCEILWAWDGGTRDGNIWALTRIRLLCNHRPHSISPHRLPSRYATERVE